MKSYIKSYRCDVCRWRGRMEPQDAGDAAPCPQCGTYLYPLSWGQTWGLALGLIGATVLFVVVATWALPRF